MIDRQAVGLMVLLFADVEVMMSVGRRCRLSSSFTSVDNVLVIHNDQTRPDTAQFMSSSAVVVVICHADFAINIMSTCRKDRQRQHSNQAVCPCRSGVAGRTAAQGRARPAVYRTRSSLCSYNSADATIRVYRL